MFQNTSTDPDDKAWTLLKYAEPKRRAEVQASDPDLDVATIQKILEESLTMIFTHKDDETTTKTVIFPAPTDWNSKEEVSKLVKTIGQYNRRIAGVKHAARKAYGQTQIEWLEQYFASRAEYHGKTTLPNTTWEDIAIAFNAQFSEERSRKGVRALCERTSTLRTARGLDAK